ncbi:MAG: 4Fe-4S dicluster domain-containing protein [Syntrophomonadaceae bacterium]
MERVIKKTDFFKLFLENLKAKYQVIGPTRRGGGTSSYAYATFDYIDRAIELELSYGSTMGSIKKLFFPDHETLYQYKKNGQDFDLVDQRKVWDKEKLILGLRPCDITALRALDEVFMSDPHYQDKRNRSIIIGLTCISACPRGFCSSVGSGPDIESGYDILLTDIGDTFFCRSGSDRGEDLISEDYFKDADDQERQMRAESMKKVESELVQIFSLDKVTSILADKYNDDLWDEFADKCFTCGSCNMVCPTCTCFTINDRTKVDYSEGKRIIVWDSCHFERFAQMAGNFNLREEKKSRFKHRIYDKFHFSLVRNGKVSCVGCGRCAEFCPSHIDIRDALSKV